MIYNIGGQNEFPNIDVAKALIKELGPESQQDALLTFVGDRAFNDLRYTISTDKLEALGWKEETSWGEGLKKTVECTRVSRTGTETSARLWLRTQDKG